MIDQTSSDDFRKWQAQWDLAAKQFAKDATSQLEAAGKTVEKTKPTSFFNNAPLDTDYTAKPVEAEPSWQDIYRRSMDLSKLFVDWDNGETKPIANWGAFTPVKTNPTQQSTTGPDASPAPTEPIRVARNYSDGPELRELDQLKRGVEAMERKHHRAEVEGGKEMYKELQSLRARIERLSEIINRFPEVDVT